MLQTATQLNVALIERARLILRFQELLEKYASYETTLLADLKHDYKLIVRSDIIHTETCVPSVEWLFQLDVAFPDLFQDEDYQYCKRLFQAMDDKVHYLWSAHQITLHKYKSLHMYFPYSLLPYRISGLEL